MDYLTIGRISGDENGDKEYNRMETLVLPETKISIMIALALQAKHSSQPVLTVISFAPHPI